MQRLILMRHAKTEPWSEGIDDHARALLPAVMTRPSLWRMRFTLKAGRQILRWFQPPGERVKRGPT